MVVVLECMWILGKTVRACGCVMDAVVMVLNMKTLIYLRKVDDIHDQKHIHNLI